MNPRIDYSKCIRIIESCITLKQLQGAIQYSRLALRNESYFIDELRAAFPEDKYYARFFESEAEAIAAAQADFNQRVLENLLHGVADEKG